MSSLDGGHYTDSDWPTYALCTELSEVPGTNGKIAMQQYLPQFRKLLERGHDTIMIDAATASGKSREVPSALANFLYGKVLVMTPSTVDVKGMHNDCKWHYSCYRMGGGLRDGCTWKKAKIVFATVGLVENWHAKHGLACFDDFDGIFFDEMDTMETDASYALLWDAALEARRRRAASASARLVGASATFSEALRARLNDACAKWICCPERPYPVQQYTLQVPTRDQIWTAAAHVAKVSFQRQRTSLVFLPGKYEINLVKDMLLNSQVAEGSINMMHGDMEPGELDRVKQGSWYNRIILATSIAEKSVTIPDVDDVIDCGYSRTLLEYHDLLEISDYPSSPAVQQQRLGRAGRVKPGSCIRIANADRKEAYDLRFEADDPLMRVLALQPHHARLQANALSLCEIPAEILEQARYKLKSLQLSNEDMWTCLTKIPLPLKDGAILMKAMNYGVAYEAAALLAVSTQCQLRKDVHFGLRDIIALVTGTRHYENVFRINKAKQLFYHLRRQLRLGPTVYPDGCEERLAVAFLDAPERLLWCDQKGCHGACFLGEPVHNLPSSGYVVAVLLSKSPYTGISCAFYLPVTEWVIHTSALQLPLKTARVVGDSTLMCFRAECCNSLRLQGYDVKVWYCKAGASEDDVASAVAITGQADLCIAIPNGNGLERQKDARRYSWINEACEHLCAALRTTSTRAILFVGDADLSPGVRYPDVYSKLVRRFQAGLRERDLAVVGRIPGVVLSADGIHWGSASRCAVGQLMGTLCAQARCTAKLRVTRPPLLWNWRRLDGGRYFPACIPCKGTILTEAHLKSDRHKQNTRCCELSYDFPRRIPYVEQGAVLYVNGDPKQGVETANFLPGTHPLTSDNLAGPNAPVSAWHVTGFRLEPVTNCEPCPTVRISRTCRAVVQCADGNTFEDVYTMNEGAHGKKRSVLSAVNEPWVVKVEYICRGENRNWGEWNEYRKTAALRELVPQVHGYFEQEINGERISLSTIHIIAQGLGPLPTTPFLSPQGEVPWVRLNPCFCWLVL